MFETLVEHLSLWSTGYWSMECPAPETHLIQRAEDARLEANRLDEIRKQHARDAAWGAYPTRELMAAAEKHRAAERRAEALEAMVAYQYGL